MVSKPLVTFVRTDKKPLHIEKITIEIADHFKVHRVYVPQFCKFISNSKRWKHDNWEEQFNRWKERFSKINPNETKKIISLVKSGFENCVNNEEINDLRGCMFEALIMGAYGGGTRILSDVQYGWGARIDLNLDTGIESVRHRELLEDKTGYLTRSTVDFGYWNSKHGKFYECKVQPKSLTDLEINYMTTLRTMLTKYNINHEIYFAFAASKDTVTIELKKFNLETFFKPIGYEDISEMISA